MKKLIAGFVVVLGIIVVSMMYNASLGSSAEQAQQVQAAQQTRPRDLQLLKRAAVRTACSAHADWNMDTCQTMDQEKVSIGMSADQVRLSWGKPERINVTQTASVDHEQWIYSDRERLYVDDGILKSVQTSR
jgi:hypothetical protein